MLKFSLRTIMAFQAAGGGGMVGKAGARVHVYDLGCSHHSGTTQCKLLPGSSGKWQGYFNLLRGWNF